MRNILVICFVVLIVGLSYAAISPDYAPGTVITEPTDSPVSDQTWVTLAPFPITRAHCMVSPIVEVGGVKKYYVFGGPTVSGGAQTNDNYEYNTETNTWTLRAPMPTARGIGRAVLVQGKIYVIGGCVTFGTGLTTVEIYDPVTNTWTTGPSMPVGNHDFGAGVYKDTFIYVCGGGNWATGSPPTNAVRVLNTVTGVWSSATPMPTAMGTPGCGIIGNKIIMATGYVAGAGSNIVQIGTIDPNDPTQITWTTGATMPGPVVYRANSGVAQGYLYVCGGNLATGISNAAYKYDPATNTWTALPNKPTAVSNVYGWAADPAGKLYFPVGYNGTTYVTAHEMLTDIAYTNDVGVDQIVSPGALHQPNTPMTPQAKVKNYGTANQADFAVRCSMVNPGGTVRFSDTRTISLAAGRDTIISFTSWTPTETEMLTVIMRTFLVGDENPTNDRKTSTCNVSTSTQIIIGTATTYQRTEPLDRYYNYNTHEVIYRQSEIGSAGNITHIAYERELGVNTDPITPVDIYMCHTTEAVLPSGTVTIPPSPPYELVYSGPFPNDAGTGWREVQLTTPFYYNNIENLRILIVKGYQAYIPSANCPQWRYTTTSPTYLTRGARSDGSQPTSLTQTYNRPNIRLTMTTQPPPANDVGVVRIITPLGSHQANTPMTPRAVVRNYGTATQTNFPVACSIVGPYKVVRYHDTKYVTSLAANETTVVTFATWTPTITEYESVFVRTLLAGDERPDNNRKSGGFLVHAFILMEGFNDVVFPPPGWDTIRVSGTSANNTWSRQTSGTNPTCMPIEGVAMARYYSYLASAGNSSRLRSPAIDLGTTPQPCTLKFYMTRDPGYSANNDRITVQTSTDGISWTDIVTIPRYAPAFAWEEQSVYLGNLSGVFYFGFLGISEFGNNIFIDDVRLKGRALGVEENRQDLTLVTGLNAAQPNPTTKGLANISFTLAGPQKVSLTIYDASGRLIKTLANGHLTKGTYNYTWNGTDDNGRKVAEGIYFYTLKTAEKKYTKKLVFTR